MMPIHITSGAHNDVDQKVDFRFLVNVIMGSSLHTCTHALHIHYIYIYIYNILFM